MEFGNLYDDDEDDSTAMGVGDDELTPTAKGPLSPPSGAESLFLAGLATSRLSAVSLSQQIRKNHHIRYTTSSSTGGSSSNSAATARRRTASAASLSSYVSARSAGTDDFASCVESESDLLDIVVDPKQAPPPSSSRLRNNLNNMTIEFSSPRSMILQIPEDAQFETKDTNMTTTYANTKYATKSTPTTKDAPSSSSSSPSSSPDLSKTDAAEVIYSKAKDVWTWGKTVPLVGFFVTTTETVTGKALGVVGTNFTSLDGTIATELEKLDVGVLNPAIEAIAKVVLQAASKSEETLKPILDILMSKLGLIKSEADESTPDAHKPPEVTPSTK